MLVLTHTNTSDGWMHHPGIYMSYRDLAGGEALCECGLEWGCGLMAMEASPGLELGLQACDVGHGSGIVPPLCFGLAYQPWPPSSVLLVVEQ